MASAFGTALIGVALVDSVVFQQYRFHINTETPLLVRWPGRQADVHTHRTSHYDVVPTLMDEFLGCRNAYEDYSVGHPLLQPGGRELLVLSNSNEYAVVQPDRIIAVFPHGVEVLDENNRPIPGATYDRDVMLKSLQIRSRFY